MKLLTLSTALALLGTLLVGGIALGEQQQGDVQIQISAKQLNSQQVLALQQALKEQGIDPGPVDGILGPLTEQGIRLFQQQQGLATTGNLNDPTLDALGFETQEFLGLSPAYGQGQEMRADQQQSQQEETGMIRVSLDQLNSAQVLKIQQQLKDHGIDPGPVDGVMGPLTKQGIQVLQQQKGLAATGNLNEQTLEALNIETQEFMGLSPAFE